MMDLGVFLAPLTGSNPSGLDLRNEARFHALERLFEPANRPARAEAEKTSGPGAVALDWAQALETAQDLAASGRDLRLLVIVTRILTNEQGLDGFASGLQLLTETLGQYWDSVHPGLRENPSPREAAIRRINAIYQIENADSGPLCDLEFTVFLNPRGIGPVTGADLAAGAVNRAVFINEAPSGLGEKEMAALVAQHEARLARVRTACKATAAERPDAFAALADGVRSALQQLGALEAVLNGHVTENGVGVRFQALATFLARLDQTLANAGTEPAAALPPEAEAPRPPEGVTKMQPAQSHTADKGAMNGAAIPGRIGSRAEVEQCLDLIIDFYERTEPSSPIPHLARRMRKMVPMNFMQLMEEIAPSGMKEFRNVAGVYDERAK